MTNSVLGRKTTPFNTLTRIDANVRRSGKDTDSYKAGIEQLAASILVQDLLQNLVVVARGELLGVVAGERRYCALELLVSRNQIPDDYPVPILEVADESVTAASLAENVQRKAMHPADEYDAFVQLVAEGWTIDRIADSFGVTALVVERRLKLAAAAPALLDVFRAGNITTDQLIALCATDNHDMQTTVWQRLGPHGYANSPSSLRNAVLESEVDSDDERVAFIGGVAAYEAAGGALRCDLFSEAGQGAILEDVPLLEKLVMQKLDELAEGIRSEGWGWVEVWPLMEWDAYHRLGRINCDVLPDEDSATVAQLQSEIEEEYTALSALHDLDDLTQEQRAECSEHRAIAREKEDQVRALYETAKCAPELMPKVGAIVYMQQGSVTVKRGLVRTADREDFNELSGSKVAGGRESEPAGRKTNTISDALRRSLLGHRNHAAQMVTAKNAHSAKVLMACWLVESMRRQYGSAPTDLSLSTHSGTRTGHPISDSSADEKSTAFASIGAALVDSLPTESVALWAHLDALKPADLDALVSYAVADSVSLSEKADGLTGCFLQSLDFNMADHFTPTADNYFGRVPKELTIIALDEAGKIEDDEDRAALLAMKRGVLAVEAEKRMAGSGWVPECIRTETVQSKPEKAGKTKKAA